MAFPIIWRYLLAQYLKVLALAVVSFLAVLFVARLKQLAQFAAIGAGAWDLARFALYLVPYVLPVALPIACLISAIVLFQRLSHSHELAALRSCGMGLRHIFAPILVMAAALTLLNFYVASELATHCHLLGNQLRKEKSSVNPLSLLQNSQLMRFGDLFVDMRTRKVGEEAEDVTVALFNPSTSRLNLLTAERLRVDNEQLFGNHVCVVATLPSSEAEAFDPLVLENQQTMSIHSAGLANFIGTTHWKPKNHHLRLKLLAMRLREDPHRLWAEVGRRCSLALAVLTFTLMGCTFGIGQSRSRSYRSVIQGVGLAALFIGCFLTAQEMGEHAIAALSLFFAPQLLIVVLCMVKLRNIVRGRVG